MDMEVPTGLEWFSLKAIIFSSFRALGSSVKKEGDIWRYVGGVSPAEPPGDGDIP